MICADRLWLRHRGVMHVGEYSERTTAGRYPRASRASLGLSDCAYADLLGSDSIISVDHGLAAAYLLFRSMLLYYLGTG